MASLGHILVIPFHRLGYPDTGNTDHCVGLAFFFTACVALFAAAQVMFEHREDELRQGINMKC